MPPSFKWNSVSFQKVLYDFKSFWYPRPWPISLKLLCIFPSKRENHFLRTNARGASFKWHWFLENSICSISSKKIWTPLPHFYGSWTARIANSGHFCEKPWLSVIPITGASRPTKIMYKSVEQITKASAVSSHSNRFRVVISRSSLFPI